jgi:hypothetical protein
MKKSANDKKKVAKNLAKVLADVPIDNKQERDALRARIRQKYVELEPLKVSLNRNDRERRARHMPPARQEVPTCSSRTRPEPCKPEAGMCDADGSIKGAGYVVEPAIGLRIPSNSLRIGTGNFAD